MSKIKYKLSLFKKWWWNKTKRFRHFLIKKLGGHTYAPIDLKYEVSNVKLVPLYRQIAIDYRKWEDSNGEILNYYREEIIRGFIDHLKPEFDIGFGPDSRFIYVRGKMEIPEKYFKYEEERESEENCL